MHTLNHSTNANTLSYIHSPHLLIEIYKLKYGFMHIEPVCQSVQKFSISFWWPPIYVHEYESITISPYSDCTKYLLYLCWFSFRFMCSSKFVRLGFYVRLSPRKNRRTHHLSPFFSFSLCLNAIFVFTLAVTMLNMHHTCILNMVKSDFKMRIQSKSEFGMWITAAQQLHNNINSSTWMHLLW